MATDIRIQLSATRVILCSVPGRSVPDAAPPVGVQVQRPFLHAHLLYGEEQPGFVADDLPSFGRDRVEIL